MPRELVHWDIIDGAAGLLLERGYPRLQQLLSSYWRFAYIGAVAPDAPYYLGGGGRSFERAAERIHGSAGEDTYDIPKRLAQLAVEMPTGENRDKAWAFLFGFISHCIADAYFHPPVFYYTGNYYDRYPERRAKARERHRLLETHLDLWWEQEVARCRVRYMQDLTSATMADLSWVCVLLERGVEEGSADEWLRSLKDMARAQKLFFSAILAAVFRVLAPVSPWARGVLPLLRSGRRPSANFFSRALRFENPVSGHAQEATVVELRRRAIDSCAQLFAKFDPLVSGQSQDVSTIFADERGRSLSSGLYRTSMDEMRYFAPTPNVGG